MTDTEPTYEDAVKAATILRNYLKNNLSEYLSLEEIERNHKYDYILWFALQEAFL